MKIFKNNDLFSQVNLNKYFSSAVGFLLLLLFLFVRSFTGIYLFGFRVGELIVAFSIALWMVFFLTIRKKYFEDSTQKNLKFSLFAILVSFFIVLIATKGNLFSTYTYKSSSYIWTVSFLLLGMFVYQNSNLDKFFIYTLNPTLFIAYFLQVITIPQRLIDYFLTISDKFEPHKGSDLAMLFIVTLLLNHKYYKNNKNYIIYLSLFTAFYMPFIYFKSRGAFIGVLIYLSYEVIKDRKILTKHTSFLKFFLILIFSILVFFQSVFLVKDSGIIKIYEARENVVSLAKSRNNTFIPDSPSIIWISEGKLRTADGNLNWRIDIWQDILLDLKDVNQQIYGYGYNSIIPVMEWEDGYRQGLDGLNENVHNNWFNIYARGGILQIGSFLVFYFMLLRAYKFKHKNLEILKFIVPLMFVSFFDSSMENAHFPILYYFFLGRIFLISK
jgi:hypothetical protein